MHLGDAELALWYLNIGAATLMLLRLYREHLAAIYSAVFAYLLTDTIQQALGLALLHNQTWYGWVYIAGQALKVALGIGVVLQLYRLALVQQPALARFGRRMLGYFFGFAVIISAIALSLDEGIRKDSHPILRGFLRFERTVDLVTLVVLLLVSCFLLWFPVRVRRNVALCIGGFAIYSFVRWAGLLLVNLWPTSTRELSLAMLAATCVCLVTWLVTLRRAGEAHMTQTGHRWNAAEAERLTLQLDAINSRLVRLVR